MGRPKSTAWDGAGEGAKSFAGISASRLANNLASSLVNSMAFYIVSFGAVAAGVYFSASYVRKRSIDAVTKTRDAVSAQVDGAKEAMQRVVQKTRDMAEGAVEAVKEAADASKEKAVTIAQKSVDRVRDAIGSKGSEAEVAGAGEGGGSGCGSNTVPAVSAVVRARDVAAESVKAVWRKVAGSGGPRE